MRTFLRNSIVVCSCLILPASVWAWPKKLPQKNIVLTYNSGAAPLSVRIIGPMELTLLGRGNALVHDWCDYKVIWGDGARTDYYKEYKRGLPPANCSAGLEHVYQKPGTFVLKVIRFHDGPAHHSIKDWVGRAQVLVRAPQTLSL